MAGGRSINGLDCWGLVFLVYAETFGISLPTFPGLSVSNLTAETLREVESQWTQVEKPFEGCLVAMSQRSAIHHVGIYTSADGGRVVHCREHSNVVVDTLRGLSVKGFQVIKFYRHTLWPTS